MSADDPVLYELLDSGVAVLTLNRPERMNGWGGGLAAKFYALLDQAEADPNVRAIVVTGSGRAFCAGADMGDLSSIENASHRRRDRHQPSWSASAIRISWRRCASRSSPRSTAPAPASG